MARTRLATAGPVHDPFWSTEMAGLLDRLECGERGLTGAEAAAGLARDGRNSIAGARRHTGVRLFLSQFTDPIVLILAAGTVLSLVLGDVTDGLIILAII